MKQRFGVNMVHVPYRNTPQSITDIVAGHVQLGFAEAGASLPLIREGKLRALAVSASTRLPTLPDVPPFAEAANAPGFEAVSWHMLFAPAATPKPIVDKLHAEMNRIMSDPEMKQKASDHRPVADRPAFDRRYGKISGRGTGKVGLAGEEARAGRVAVAALIACA